MDLGVGQGGLQRPLVHTADMQVHLHCGQSFCRSPRPLRRGHSRGFCRSQRWHSICPGQHGWTPTMEGITASPAPPLSEPSLSQQGESQAQGVDLLSAQRGPPRLRRMGLLKQGRVPARGQAQGDVLWGTTFLGLSLFLHALVSCLVLEVCSPSWGRVCTLRTPGSRSEPCCP